MAPNLRLLALGTTVLCLLIRGTFAAPLDSSKAEAYLTQYGYLNPPATLAGAEDFRDQTPVMQDAVKSFQEFAGLTVTGELDTATLDKMGKDRCALPDNAGHGSHVRRRRRRRRYVLQGSKWPSTNIQYYFMNLTRTNISAEQNKQIVRKAFQFWTNASSLVASETSLSSSANIRILYGVRYHGDLWPFDGRGGVLAHAFYPDMGGDAHFDDDEEWTDGSALGTNLLQVTTHELGHSLGLEHSSVPGAVMEPFYNGYNPNFHLGQDDIDGIRYLYGPPEDQSSPSTPTSSTLSTASTIPTPSPTPSSVSTSMSTTTSTTTSVSTATTTENPLLPPFCATGTVDAIVSVGPTTYAFQGSMYAVLGVNGIVPGYPRYIMQDWPDLPNDLDTVLYLDEVVEPDSNGNRIVTEPAHLYFFKDVRCWSYNNTFQLVDGYPKLINDEFPGIPDYLDASFVWSGNGQIYFIKGEEYYRYTRGLGTDATYPRTLAVWRGLPMHIDAAFQWTNGRTYFFSGTDYYRFDDINFYVDAGYPKPTAPFWFGCPVSDWAAPANLQMEQQEADDQFRIATPGPWTS